MCCADFSNDWNFTEPNPKMEHVLETNVTDEPRKNSSVTAKLDACD